MALQAPTRATLSWAVSPVRGRGEEEAHPVDGSSLAYLPAGRFQAPFPNRWSSCLSSGGPAPASSPWDMQLGVREPSPRSEERGQAFQPAAPQLGTLPQTFHPFLGLPRPIQESLILTSLLLLSALQPDTDQRPANPMGDGAHQWFIFCLTLSWTPACPGLSPEGWVEASIQGIPRGPELVGSHRPRQAGDRRKRDTNE